MTDRPQLTPLGAELQKSFDGARRGELADFLGTLRAELDQHRRSGTSAAVTPRIVALEQALEQALKIVEKVNLDQDQRPPSVGF